MKIIGVIPCSGIASRMRGIPKFLLPCPNKTLLENTIDLFKENDITNIHACVSSVNEMYFLNKNINYIVEDTETMSETVNKIIKVVDADTYILIMPDTYFKLTNELTKMKELLQKYDIVVIIWKIRVDQYGKLGQININESHVTDIKDKDINCNYPYSWGVIGWNNNINKLIDEKTQHIGYILNKALELNIKIGYVISLSEYFDCGTYSEYFDMIKKYT